MGLFAVALVIVYFGNEVDGRVGAGEVFGYTEGFGVVVYIAELAWKDRFGAGWECDRWWDESRGSRDN